MYVCARVPASSLFCSAVNKCPQKGEMVLLHCCAPENSCYFFPCAHRTDWAKSGWGRKKCQFSLLIIINSYCSMWILLNSIAASLFWVQKKEKFTRLTYQDIQGCAHQCLKRLLTPHTSSQSLRSNLLAPYKVKQEETETCTYARDDRGCCSAMIIFFSSNSLFQKGFNIWEEVPLQGC